MTASSTALTNGAASSGVLHQPFAPPRTPQQWASIILGRATSGPDQAAHGKSLAIVAQLLELRGKNPDLARSVERQVMDQLGAGDQSRLQRDLQSAPASLPASGYQAGGGLGDAVITRTATLELNRNAVFYSNSGTTDEHVSALIAGVRDMPPARAYDVVQARLGGELARVEAQAFAEYGRGRDGQIMAALAGNAFIMKTYAAIVTEVPNFHWAHTGMYVAHQVRGELLSLHLQAKAVDQSSAYMVNAAGIVAGRTLANTYYDMINDVYRGQKAIFADIAPFALGYQAKGAAAMADLARARTDIRSNTFHIVAQAFDIQARSNSLERDTGAVGDQPAITALRVEAAQRLGYHEQRLIQKALWDGVRASSGGKVNAIMGMAGAGSTTNIYVGLRGNPDHGVSDRTIGIIDAPGLFRGDVSQFEYRLGIAIHAFDWMGSNILSNTSNYNSHMAIANQIFHGSLYNFNRGDGPSRVTP